VEHIKTKALSSLLALAIGLTVFLSPSGANAQDDFAAALKQTVNLAPKVKRGDVRKYLATVETLFLDNEGKPKQWKRDWLGFSQLCLGNTTDSGVVYQITIDSFSVGQKLFMDMRDQGRALAKQFTGKSFTYRINHDIPVNHGCYGFLIDFPQGQRYAQSYDMMECFTAFNILEQLRYTAGTKLSHIGDEVRIQLPAPVCYSVPNVIKSTKVEFSPFRLTLDGFTLYKGSPCALTSITPLFARTSMELFTADTTSFGYEGFISRMGELRVRLSDGDIVYARIRDRVDASTTAATPTAESQDSRSYRTFTFTQIF